ncbi:MAG: signal peptidase I [Candidatus Methylomirabilales bacterium]
MMAEIASESGRTRTKDDRVFFDWHYVRGLKERRRHYRLAFILFWSILIAYFVQGYVVTVGLVIDRSMHPTLSKEGYYLINKYIYQFTSPERGDIVVFKRTPDADMLDAKRIIGLPGETVLIKSGGVYINGHRLEEPYAVGRTHPDLGPYSVAEGTYYVLGDSRWVREDSREFGSLQLKEIEGKIAPDKLFPFR